MNGLINEEYIKDAAILQCALLLSDAQVARVKRLVNRGHSVKFSIRWSLLMG
jgi:hypothetical protein